MRLALAMIPAWAAELEVAEQSLDGQRMATILRSGFPTVRATTLSLEVFLYLLLDQLSAGLPQAVS
jgi:hypothetical protein